MRARFRLYTLALAGALAMASPVTTGAADDDMNDDMDGYDDDMERHDDDMERHDDAGFFIGGSYGLYTSQGGEYDDEDSLYGLKAGYQFSDALAIQAGYFDFGEFGDNDSAELKGVNLSLRLTFPITERIGLYGKLGAFSASFDVDTLNDSESYDEVDPLVGIGADYEFTDSWTGFVEYNRYSPDIDEDDFPDQFEGDNPDFDTTQIGVRYLF